MCLGFDYSLGAEERPPRTYYTKMWLEFMAETFLTLVLAALASRPRLIATAVQWAIALLGSRTPAETISVETAPVHV